MTSSASGVEKTAGAFGLEEPEWIRVIADQHTLGLRVVLEHHAVVLTADAGRLVAAERRVCRVLVVAVGPHPAGLDCAAHAERAAAVARPHAGSESVQRVVCDLESLLLGAERRHREHGPEDLLLEHAHLVVALQ